MSELNLRSITKLRPDLESHVKLIHRIADSTDGEYQPSMSVDGGFTRTNLLNQAIANLIIATLD